MAIHNPFEQQKPIPGVKYILAVSSGKGGVGKSTVATHLATALSKKFKVGLLDADIYGPSIPKMMGAHNKKPQILEGNKLEPVRLHQVKVMSLGFLIEEGAAVVWRGPMLFKAMDQLLKDVAWGELDFLIVDLPPGTGDVPLSLAQKVPVSGAVIVTTPQNISLIDVKKAIDMYKRIGVPILGMVENMSYLVVNGERVQLFPKGELDSFLENEKIKKLAEVTFNPSMSMASEAGIPLIESHPTAPESQVFRELADSVVTCLNVGTP